MIPPKKPWKFSIFGRLVIMFLLIIIPIYIIGIHVYNWGIEKVKEYITNSAKSQVEFYISSIEKDVDRIKTMQFDFVNDSNLIQLAQIPDEMSDYDRTNAIQQLQNRLGIIKNSSLFINNVSVHIPALNRTIFAFGSIGAIPRERFDYLFNNRLSLKDNILYFQKSMILNMVYPNYADDKGSTPEFIIDVELSKDSLKKSLEPFCEYLDSGVALITPQECIPVLKQSDTKTLQEILKGIGTESMRQGSAIYTSLVGKKRYMVILRSSSYLNIKMVKYFPEVDIFTALKEYEIWFYILTLASVIIIFLFALSTYRIIHKPIVKLVKAFKRLEMGDFNLNIQHKQHDEFEYLYRQFNATVENLNVQIDQVYKQKILTQRAEYKHLQSQINPHFLYNSFYQIYNMVVSENYTPLEHFAKLLGKYFQYITRNAVEEVPLIQEVNHAITYTEIQNQRFHNRIRTIFDELPEKCYYITVPRLIIQPIIENAFEHGLVNKAADGTVKISFNLRDKKLDIIIEDNGEELTDEILSNLQAELSSKDESIEITGIVNVHKRISLKFGEDSNLKVERSLLGGLKVTLSLVFEGGYENHV